jgi:hypothetical protein
MLTLGSFIANNYKSQNKNYLIKLCNNNILYNTEFTNKDQHSAPTYVLLTA